MNIIINEEVADDARIFLELTANKTTGVVGYSAVTGSINVLCLNAAHRAWRRGGRSFRSFAEATAAYKSAEMRAFISLLHDRVLERFPERFMQIVDDASGVDYNAATDQELDLLANYGKNRDIQIAARREIHTRRQHAEQ